MTRTAVGPDRVLQLEDDPAPLAVNDVHALANEAHRQINEYDRALSDEITWTRSLAEAREALTLAKAGPWNRFGPGGELIVNGKNADQREAQVREALEKDPTYIRARNSVWDAEKQIADARRRAEVADRRQQLQLRLLDVLAGKR